MAMMSTLDTSLASDEPHVDPSLVTVLTSGTHRFLLYRHCDAEFCWSEAYLQWMDVKAKPNKVHETVPISEISKPMMVFDAKLHWDGDTQEQWIEMRGTAHPAMSFIGTAVIKPRDAGQYDFESNIAKISN
ncbi:MAG: hypothetical protein QNI98_01360 [Woeseiaceae bacterium]|nr:hypothetical protein [Woeseiaceae bacterium]